MIRNSLPGEWNISQWLRNCIHLDSLLEAAELTLIQGRGECDGEDALFSGTVGDVSSSLSVVSERGGMRVIQTGREWTQWRLSLSCARAARTSYCHVRARETDHRRPHSYRNRHMLVSICTCITSNLHLYENPGPEAIMIPWPRSRSLKKLWPAVKKCWVCHISAPAALTCPGNAIKSLYCHLDSASMNLHSLSDIILPQTQQIL